ncbi:MAG TPA: UDP-N-acetylglucosamine 2-epimerase (non-hydrolyzing) [Acidimicrobiia bacterium]|nr:UDP-N-acetylglucosamine 2-epimerase (non-hydrolyzing) [Acidimicrobiia bacterium]
MRVVCVAGARPNFMKIAPVLGALDAAGADTVLVHTGQHYDEAMSQVFFEELDLRKPDEHLGVGSGSHAEQTARVMVAFETLLAKLAADVVVVVGDVNSTLACSIVAAKGGLLVAHVEAGLRSRDWAMPEEVNRVVTDRVSDYLFAPSADAVENLRAEGYRDDQIHLVGNVMVDTLLHNVERARTRGLPPQLALQPKKYALLTLHRPSNVDDPVVLARLFGAVGEVARQIPVVFPAHPRTRERMRGLEIPAGVVVTDPLGYLDFLVLQADAALVLTDSGGIQEETTALGVACLTLRESTERPITVSEGTNRLVGTDPAAIIAAARTALRGEVEARCPALWDGFAAPRIARVIMEGGTADDRLRPTDLPERRS